jgi:hypothetical protein
MLVKDHFDKLMRDDPAFAAAWKELEPEFQRERARIKKQIEHRRLLKTRRGRLNGRDYHWPTVSD